MISAENHTALLKPRADVLEERSRRLVVFSSPDSESEKRIVERKHRFGNVRSATDQFPLPYKANHTIFQSSSGNQALYSPLKRGIDIVGSSILLLATAPMLGAISLAIRLSSPGPAIFRQCRMTDGGRLFTMYKFRTMVLDAEAKTGAVWASDHDPRVTRLGRFLRHFRLDELPQLFNVLKGDMSLIGPRPERPEMAEMLRRRLPSFERRHAVRAGITGLAQTSGGYASCLDTYRRKLAFDILYVKNRCLLLDLRIAARTVVVILTGSGAK